MTTVAELEQRIKEGETLLAQERVSGWMPLTVSLIILFSMAIKMLRSDVYLLLTGLALLYLGFNIWRVVRAQRNVKQLEAKIQQYRDQKATLQNPRS